MAKLTEDVQTFIVQRLACYDSPQQVADAVKDQFNGLAIDRRQVETYDAMRAGKKPAEKWVALFTATRKKFLDTVDEIPIAQKSVRLRRLDRMALEAEKVRNYPLVAQLLEQAAKETGGAYTNRREVTGKDGGPIEHDVVLSDEERAVRAAGLLARARERKHAAEQPAPNATSGATPVAPPPSTEPNK